MERRRLIVGNLFVPDGFHELADTMLAHGELFDDPKARRMPQRLEERRVRFVLSSIEIHLSSTVNISH